MKSNLLLGFAIVVFLCCLYPLKAHGKEHEAAEVLFANADKYAAIAYQLVLVTNDGKTKVVPTSRVFKSGDRVKIFFKANRPGHLTILNIGSSGNTNKLFANTVEGMKEYVIPQKGAMKFVGKPGVERVLLMLASQPGGTQQAAQQQAPSQQESPPPAAQKISSSSPEDSLTSCMPTLLASLQGAKDIVIEDDLGTGYAVVSTNNAGKAGTVTVTGLVVGSHKGSSLWSHSYFFTG